MANGTRDDAITGVETDLYYQFLKNGQPYSPQSVNKVEIYDSISGDTTES